jgi:hypothetical protein
MNNTPDRFFPFVRLKDLVDRFAIHQVCLEEIDLWDFSPEFLFDAVRPRAKEESEKQRERAGER